MLQQTLETLEREFDDNNDACIDAAKAIVECACQVIIKNLDDPASPVWPQEDFPPMGKWVSTAVRVLKLSDIRDNVFQKLISDHNRMTTSLNDLRNKAGTLSHGKDGFIAKLSVHHRRAALLAADAIITFLHESYLEREPDPVLTFEPYDRLQNSNELIDRYATVRARTDDDGLLLATVMLPEGDEIPLTVEPSRLLFGVDREAYKQALTACREAAASELPDEGDSQ